MIEWESFLLVAVISLVAASAVVTIASFGMKLYENALQARTAGESSGRVALAVSRVLFGLCGFVVLFGVYLIIPAFHRIFRPHCPSRVRSPIVKGDHRMSEAPSALPIVDPQGPTRTESDTVGPLEIPADAYWGIHTARARENFPITRRPISVYPELIQALAMVKQAAARANKELGSLSAEKADLIDQVCQEIIDGNLHDQFMVGVIQGGAGTSTNMNTNEVIANRCLELLGKPFGDYANFHPIDDVNRSQSTNDVYPTAIKTAMVISVKQLLEEHVKLTAAFARKGTEFAHILKVGRTQMQDAVPMTLGQEFNGFAHTIAEDYDRLSETIPWLNEINMGATAIGTGITADPRYAAAVCRHLADITGFGMVTAGDLIEATSDVGIFMTLSGHLKRAAVKLSKICNDLRLLSSGPQAGFGEINLPVRQAGSSIMPGKVNPVIPEVVNQVAFSVIGADATVTAAAEGGQLQLNAFEPVIAHSILQSLAWMKNACYTLRVHCIDGITANEARLAAQVSSSVGVVTALTPYIGYAASATLAHTALTTNASIADLVVEAGLMKAEEVARVLSPERLSGIMPPTGVINIIPDVAITDA